MASLNLRDRVLETTIAYVGGSAIQRHRNLERLARLHGPTGDVPRGANGLWTVAVRPTHLGKINGCDVLLHLVASELEDTPVCAALEGADGAVLLPPAVRPTPDVVAEAVAAVAERLHGTGVPVEEVPVVLQIEDAELPSWTSIVPVPVVHASADDDRLAVETLDTAMRRVAEALRRPRRLPPRPRVVPAPEPTPPLGLRRRTAPPAAPPLDPSEPRAPIATPIAVPAPSSLAPESASETPAESISRSSSPPPRTSSVPPASAEVALLGRLSAIEVALGKLRTSPETRPATDLTALDLQAQTENLERVITRRTEAITAAIDALVERIAALEQLVSVLARASS